MRNESKLALMLLASIFVLSGCLSGTADTVIEDGELVGGAPPTDPPANPPPSDPPPQPGGGFKAIPAVPFEYEQEAGSATTSGQLPGTIVAGEVLAFTSQTVGDADLTMTCQGTEQSPAFIVGGNLQGSNSVFTVSGSWCIFDGTVFDNVQVRTSSANNIAFRNIEVLNHSGKNGMNLGGNNIVVADSEIHHNQGDDRHGIFVSSGSDGVWVLRNHIHHNGGDGFQACHGCSANPPRNVYIGHNIFNSDRENAVDFKYIENVIVEGNIMHSLVSAPAGTEWCFDDGSGCGVFSSGSDGSAIVVGSDGAPTNVTIIDNEIYNVVNAVRIEEGELITITENSFEDIGRQCLQLDKEGYDIVFTENTCRNADRGIFQNWRVNFSLFVENNLFDDVSTAAIEYETGGVCEDSTLVANIFTNSGPVICNNTTAITQEEVNALPNANDNIVN